MKLLLSIILVLHPFTYITAQTPFQTVTQESERPPFHIFKEIKNQLDQNGFVVIFGAPSSGKTELMELALPKKKCTFDLSEAFTTAYARKSGQEQITVFAQYCGPWTAEQEALKINQVAWLNEEKQSIIDQLIASDSNMIVMDEFDFCGSFLLNEHEEIAMKHIIDIAKEVNKSGKKIIFIIHSAAKNSSVFLTALKESFSFEAQDMVKTRFFTDEEARVLLIPVKASEKEKEEFLLYAEGSPTAYLPILKRQRDLTIAKLTEQAVTMTALVTKVTKQLNHPNVWDTMVAVAKGEMNLDEIHDETIVEGMLESSFVGRKNGKLVMPSFAKEALKR